MTTRDGRVALGRALTRQRVKGVVLSSDGNTPIVCGHKIGTFAFIGAGAVVTKEVLPYALVVGNPAKQLGWMSEYGHRLEFNEEGLATCPEGNETYQLKDGAVTKIN